MPDNVRHNDYTNLTNVTLNNITYVGARVFQDCRKLINIDLSKVEYIWSYGFANTFLLTTVNLSNLKNTTGGPFSRSGVTQFITGNNPTYSTIENGKALVRGGNKLIAYPSAPNSITLPSITELDFACITGNTVRTVILPNLKTIGNSAFYGTYNLTTLEVPNVMHIDHGGFRDCNYFTSIKLGKVAPTL